MSGRLILLLRNFQLFPQYHRFPGRSDADFRALRRDCEDFDLDILANQQRLASPPPQH
jgi:hypothetical protein